MRGSDSSRSACSRVTVSGVMSENRLAVRGLADLGEPSGSTSDTYGPYRPVRATIARPVCGSVPSSRSPEGIARSSSAFAAVSSSGARSTGMFARSSPRSTYAP